MYLLLDIDGVLNRKSDWAIPYSLNDGCIRNFAGTFKGTGAKIILISSWRKSFISRNSPDNPSYIKNLIQKLSVYGIQISGVMPENFTDRSEFASYINKKSNGDYLVLDDDISEYTKKPKNLYITDCRTGFTEKDTVKVKKMIKEIRKEQDALCI